MLIIPEVQIANGKVITRSPARDADIVHDVHPLDAVRQFEADGAERIHVVDVDAASGSGENNAELIRQILNSSLIPIQVAGGMRTVAQIEEWLERGAACVVLGTVAITDQALLADVSNRHPGAILANLATKDGLVMIDGWRTQTAFTSRDIVYDLQMTGVAGIIHTDIDRFRNGSATTLALTMELNEDVVIPVYSSGTIHSLDDIATVRYLPNIHGVIVGHALFNGRFTLPEALSVANQPGPVLDPEIETPVSSQGIQGSLNVYLSAYNLSPAARWWNRELRRAITDSNPYVDMTIPQEDLDVDLNAVSARAIQAAYENAIDSAEAVVVMLDGVENEAWTGFECGFARARGKYLIGVIAANPEPEKRASLFIAMCDELIEFQPGEDWQVMLNSIARQVSACLLFQQAS